MLMLADQQGAEDVVQEAFLGLYRRWAALTDKDKALTYVRSSVINGCRTVLRKQSRRFSSALREPDAESAEALMLLGEEHRELLAALRRLPATQREAVVLRYCLGLPEDEVAQAMNISRGTAKSASSRGLASLARILREQS
jgi:RNA polymerase sigma factor (sigma-70 family)